MVETAIQLHLDQTCEQVISLSDDPSPLIQQALNNPFLFVIFDGKRGMLELREKLVRKLPPVRAIHYQQIILRDRPLGCRFGPYSDSPLGEIISKPEIVVVDDIEDPEAERMKDAILQMKQCQTVRWIGLVPTWPIVLCPVFNIAQDIKAPIFRLDPSSVTEKLLDLSKLKLPT